MVADPWNRFDHSETINPTNDGLMVRESLRFVAVVCFDGGFLLTVVINRGGKRGALFHRPVQPTCGLPLDFQRLSLL